MESHSTVTSSRTAPAGTGGAGAPADLQARADALVNGIRSNPNQPGLIEVIQKMLAETNRAPALQRLLFEWFTIEQLDSSTKGKLLVLMTNVLRYEAHVADTVNFGLRTEAPSFKAIYRGFKHHLDNAVESIALIARLQQQQYTVQTSPKFMIAIPKSGSSLLGMCLGNMVRLTREGKLGDSPFEYRGYPSWWEQGGSHDWDLRPEIGMDPLFMRYPGGVYKGHITPEQKNLDVLEMYPASRYVITVREPRDQLAAAFCQNLRPHAGREPMNAEQVQQGIGRMIEDGRLAESLRFVGRWLAIRDPQRSIVVTYEQLMNDPLDALRRMRDLFELKLSDAQLSQVYAFCHPVTNREKGQDQSGHDRSIYPLGWTGHVNIHQQYFSPENLQAFDRVFAAFCQVCPWGAAMQSLYPQLTATA